VLAAVKLATVKPAVLELLRAKANVVSTKPPPADISFHSDIQTARFIESKDGTFREVLAGHYVNAMIASRVTPHLALQYATFLVTQTKEADVLALQYSDVLAPQAIALADVNARTTALSVAFVGELCDMGLSVFLSAVAECALASSKKRQIMCTVLLQCMQALTAVHGSCNMRHNDLHIGNVMVSFVPADAVYVYRVPGTASFPKHGIVTVPTHGVSVRVIDWGMATGDVFGVDDSARAWANDMHSPLPLAERDKDLFRIPDMALFDATELCRSMQGLLPKGSEMRHAVEETLDLLVLAPYDADRNSDNVIRRAVQSLPTTGGSQVRTPANPRAGRQNEELLDLFRALATRWDFPCEYSAPGSSEYPATAVAPENVFTTVTSLSELRSQLAGTAQLYDALARQAR
jgi:hypothetical protein